MEQPRVADLGDTEVMASLIEWDYADMPTIPDMGQVMAGLDWAAHAMVNLAMAGFEFEEVR